MSKSIRTLAALVIATTVISSAAEAGGGVRLSIGGPLGSFVAHPHLSSGPGGTMKNRGYASHRASKAAAASRLAAAHRAAKIAEARKAARAAEAHKAAKIAAVRAQKIELAREAAAERRAKIALEKSEKKSFVRTAKLKSGDTANDATPAIVVPASPVSQTAELDPKVETPPTGIEPEHAPESYELPLVQVKAEGQGEAAATAEPVKSEPAEIETATVEPVPADPVKVEVSEPAKIQTVETTEALAAKICRRFSAAIAGLIEVPCK